MSNEHVGGNGLDKRYKHLSLLPIACDFIVGGLIRIATGSETDRITTAAGIVSPSVENPTGVNVELLVIATGA